jgi:hypothetical protein
LGRLKPAPLLPKRRHVISSTVPAITEVEKLALDLPEGRRAMLAAHLLAAHLLASLPSVVHDEDEGVGEARRRDADLDASPSLGISLEQLDEQIKRRRS